MKNLTLSQKTAFIAWVLVGIFAVGFATLAVKHVVKETKAGHINWSK